MIKNIERKITVKGFAQKYGIDYATVYSGTWLVKNHTDSWKFKMYDEEELRQAIITMMTNRKAKLEKDLAKANSVLSKCGS